MDFTDYQSQPDGRFKLLLVYQEHSIKFVVLKPLASKLANEESYNFLDFSLLGTLYIFGILLTDASFVTKS